MPIKREKLYNKPGLHSVILTKTRVPMEDIDSKATLELVSEEERLFMSQVICEEVDLFYMDCYLREMLRKER